jgi:GxxExxY protein
MSSNDSSERDRLNGLSQRIIAAAIDVHKALGQGILESAYERCLTFELVQNGSFVERQKPVPLIYKGTHLKCGYRVDLLVDRQVVVEVKAVEKLERIHSAQVLSHLRLLNLKLALLINFNVEWLTRDGIKRIVNGFPD